MHACLPPRANKQENNSARRIESDPTQTVCVFLTTSMIVWMRYSTVAMGMSMSMSMGWIVVGLLRLTHVITYNDDDIQYRIDDSHFYFDDEVETDEGGWRRMKQGWKKKDKDDTVVSRSRFEDEDIFIQKEIRSVLSRTKTQFAGLRL